MFSIKSFVKSWDKFFFEEKPTEGLALFRIFWMGMIFFTFLCDMANINDFFGPHAILSLQTVKGQFTNFHLNLFHRFDASYEITIAFAVIYGLAILSSILGFHTRTSLVVAMAMMVSFHQRNIWLLCSSEVLMRIIMVYLIFSPCGNSLSIDSLRAKAGKILLPRTGSIWTLRLIQIQISVLYIWTVWHKLKGDDWIDGSALYYASRLENMTNLPLPYLMDSILFMKLSTWGTLVLELALGILIWFKEFRKPLILFGVIFHLGIEYLMSIPFFEINLIFLLMNFYTPEEHKAFVERMSLSYERFARQRRIQAIFDKMMSPFRPTA